MEMRALRSINTLTTLGVTAIALTFASGAVAQPDAATSTGNSNPPSQSGVSISFGGSSQSAGTTQDTGVTEGDGQSEQPKPKNEKLRWRGTSLTLDNSFTTQTIGIGGDLISDNPTYEMALILRPRFYLLDGDTHSIYATARLDLSREFTNADSTTRDQETLIGNIPLDIFFATKLYQSGATVTGLRVGPRVVFPANKYTYRGGTRLRVGGSLALSQSFPLAGADASWFPTASLRAGLSYLKYINASTTSTNSSFSRERQDASGRTFVSNQFSSGAKVNHELTPLVGASLDFTSSLHLSIDYTWIQQWIYGFGDTQVATTSGMVTPNRISDPQTYRVVPYFMVGVDYDLLREVGLGIGYYNSANQIGPNGERRNPFWSPDAHFFIDITANLDQIYQSAAGKRSDNAASLAAARQQARANNMRSAW